jgi:hypothetical protein
MKLIIENFRKLMEGEVIQFPQEPKTSEEDIQKIIKLESVIGDELGKIYGNQSSIPIEVIDSMGQFIDLVEGTLKK